MNFIKKTTLIVCTLIGLFTITGCPKSSTSSKPEEAKKISGKITDENGTALSDVEVKVDDKIVRTDNNGAYSIDDLSGKSQYQITVTSKDHFPGYKNVENIDNSEIFADVMVLTKQKLETIDSKTGGTIASNDGIKYDVKPNAFNLNGENYNGQVETSTRYINANQQDVISSAMPGGDFAAINTEGENGSMVSFGFFATEFTTPNGQKLNIKAGLVNASINVPSNTADPSQNNASAWIFNTSTNSWSSAGDVIKNGNEYTMPVTTQTFCNLDAFAAKAEIKGTVTNCDGKNAQDIEVKVIGFSNNKKIVSYTSKTNGNGNYLFKSVAAPSKNMEIKYQVSVNGNIKEITINPNETKTIDFDICESLPIRTCSENFSEIKLTLNNIKINLDCKNDINIETSVGLPNCNNFQNNIGIDFSNNDFDGDISLPLINGTFNLGSLPCQSGIHIEIDEPSGKTYVNLPGASGTIISNGKGFYKIDAILVNDESKTDKKRLTGYIFLPK